MQHLSPHRQSPPSRSHYQGPTHFSNHSAARAESKKSGLSPLGAVMGLIAVAGAATHMVSMEAPIEAPDTSQSVDLYTPGSELDISSSEKDLASMRSVIAKAKADGEKASTVKDNIDEDAAGAASQRQQILRETSSKIETMRADAARTSEASAARVNGQVINLLR